MLKFFRVVDGKKLYCDEKGELTKKDGETVEVTADDTTAVDIESGADEATKMLSEAMKNAVAAGDAAAVEVIKKANDAVEKFFETVEQKASARTKRVPVGAKEASFDVADVEANMKAFANSQNKTSYVFKFNDPAELKVISKTSGVIDRTGDLTGDVIEHDRDPEISVPVVRRTFLEDICRVVPTDSDTVKYTEVYNSTGAPASTAELAEIPKVDRKFRVQSKPVEKIAAISKHSVEIMKYGPELVAVIENMLKVDLKIVTEDELLSGNGTTPHLQGILGIAEELDATAVGAIRIANANRFDAIRTAVAKIVTAGEGTYMPNIILINPLDGLLLDTEKDENGAYVLPPFKTADGTLIKGVRVMETVAIDQGDFLIGDFNMMTIRPKGGFEVEFSNSDGDDFSHDIVAIKVRRFLTSVVKNNDSGAFLTGNFDEVIAALTATGS